MQKLTVHRGKCKVELTETKPGQWEFTLASFQWVYSSRSDSSLFLATSAGLQLVGNVHCPQEAVCFAMGFASLSLTLCDLFRGLSAPASHEEERYCPTDN